jgi:B-cell receptor-associated protein 31
LALITNAAQLIAENEAIKKQAESASRTASALLESSSKDTAARKAAGKEAEAAESDAASKLKAKEDEVEQLSKSLKTARVDLETMKKQSENVSKEYDHLLREHAKLQAKLEAIENGGGSGSGEASKKKN